MSKKRIFKADTQLGDKLATVVFTIMGFFAVVILILLFIFLVRDSLPFFEDSKALSGLFSGSWNPTSFTKPTYGIGSMLVSTIMLTIGAMFVSFPLGVVTAVFISFYLNPRVGSAVRILIELFSSIPSVIIGLIGIGVIAPLFMEVFHWSNGFNAYTACFLVGFMSYPTIVNLSLDAIDRVPKNLKLASLGLGASKLETIFKIMVPAAKSGILTAGMLGMGRVIGETMIVLMVSGNSLAMPLGFGDPIRTFTSTIAIEMGEVSQHSMHYHALFALAFILFIFTLLINLTADRIISSDKK